MPDAVSEEAARLLHNKERVARFFRRIPYGPGDNLDELNELVADHYVEHNPDAKQGREGIRFFFTEILSLPLKEVNGGEPLDVNLFAEGDLVVRQELRAHGMLIDIFRVEDGRITEHWDAYRPAPGADRLYGF